MAENITMTQLMEKIQAPLLVAGVIAMIGLYVRFGALETRVEVGMDDRWTGSQAKAQAALETEKMETVRIRVAALETVVAVHVGKPWHADAGLELAAIKERLKLMEEKKD